MEPQLPEFNPWERADVTTNKRDYFGKFNEFFDANKGLHSTTKLAALKASPFVVSLISYTGIQRLFMCSGMIVNSNGADGDFSSTILTSASLLKCPTRKHSIANNIKVDVYVANGNLYEGTIVGCDFHYNVAAISINSSIYQKPAMIANIDGSNEAVHRSTPTSFSLVPHRDTTITLHPDMAVIGLGRYYDHPYHIMAAPGALRLVDCDLDCKELLVADCEMTKNGIGGTIISCSGFVIGMSFYEAGYTPFLPINIAMKCMERLQNYRKVPRLWLGLKLSDLDIASLGELETLHRTFPGLVEGAVVRQVDPKSPASRAGLCMGDVIVQLDEKPVKRSLKFMSLMLDNVNKPMEVIVKRAGTIAPLTLTLIPQMQRKFNRWPIPEER